ncbi:MULTISPECIES: hypothetical protein [unclassified Rhizobium]|uniref:hypothetical protein n=1 Tax=unclassified Rhizobium TaxID=2613769 RepID=UPI001FDA6116|nr:MULTISPECIES: hypothetical protein [unclassified Rhizobium]
MAPKPSKARHDAVISEFTDLVNQTPAERMRSQILERLGLTEDDLKAMPPEEREAIEKQIADELKRQLTGDERQGQAERRYARQRLRPP